jgi:MEMO1 family protein
MKKIRSPIVDGLFYPAEREALKDLVLKLLSEAPAPEPRRDKTVRGIIVPHAAYDFAGSIAARAFKACEKKKTKTVVLLGSVHREPSEQIFITESEAFSTPLGDIPVDTAKVEDYVSCSTIINANDIPHLEEHCLEVQLPFIQLLFPEASVFPVLLGGKSKQIVEAAARALRTTFYDELETTLFVVSSNSAAWDTEDTARNQAEFFKRLLKTGDWQTLIDRKNLKETSACGAACASVLFYEQLAYRDVQCLGEAVSLDTEPEARPIVHYASYLVSEGGQ